MYLMSSIATCVAHVPFLLGVTSQTNGATFRVQFPKRNSFDVLDMEGVEKSLSTYKEEKNRCTPFGEALRHAAINVCLP